MYKNLDVTNEEVTSVKREQSYKTQAAVKQEQLTIKYAIKYFENKNILIEWIGTKYG